MLCCVVLCCVVLCCILLNCIVMHSLLYFIALYCIAFVYLYWIVLYCTVLYCTIFYSIVSFCIVFETWTFRWQGMAAANLELWHPPPTLAEVPRSKTDSPDWKRAATDDECNGLNSVIDYFPPPASITTFLWSAPLQGAQLLVGDKGGNSDNGRRLLWVPREATRRSFVVKGGHCEGYLHLR